MDQHALTWTVIDRTAEKLGVSPAARKKWRSRKVPWEWQLKIIEDLKGNGINVALSDFEGVQPSRIAA